ncbi:hypothetical protein QZH41_014367, partial [Actinostola sp. cb2023]
MDASGSEKKGKACEVGSGMKMTLYMIRTRFPSVPQMQTEELDDFINSSNEERRQVVLLDVRSKQEFQVSHLANAHSVNPNKKMSEVLALINM